MLLLERVFQSLSHSDLSLQVIKYSRRPFHTIDVLLPVPTTAGTGSETTGTAILDITSRSFKTGIANRAMKPVLGIVDPHNTESCPTAVHISAGLDVLFHSMESYTAIP
jgi:Alcohol dehydrogenase, class IV